MPADNTSGPSRFNGRRIRDSASVFFTAVPETSFLFLKCSSIIRCRIRRNVFKILAAVLGIDADGDIRRPQHLVFVRAVFLANRVFLKDKRYGSHITNASISGRRTISDIWQLRMKNR
jgi:hypothetical protein